MEGPRELVYLLEQHLSHLALVGPHWAPATLEALVLRSARELEDRVGSWVETMARDAGGAIIIVSSVTALAGLAPAATGLIFGMGLRLAAKLERSSWCIALAVVTFVAIGLLHWPLLHRPLLHPPRPHPRFPRQARRRPPQPRQQTQAPQPPPPQVSYSSRSSGSTLMRSTFEGSSCSLPSKALSSRRKWPATMPGCW